MAKIIRKNQKIFGQNALTGQIGVFGSLAAGSPATTTDPETIQSLSNYLAGWFSGVVGSNSPAIEDINALNYLYAYQLAYLMQAGIAEYNVNTTYYIDSYVQSSGVIYKSLTDNNLGNAVSNATHWQVGFSNSSLSKMTNQTIKGNVSGISAVPSDLSAQDVRTMIYAQPTTQKFTSGSGTYTTPANVKFIKVKMVGGGGGGATGAINSFGTVGGNGGNTTFGSLTCNGGQGGQGREGGQGGTATLGIGDGFAIAGAWGTGGDGSFSGPQFTTGGAGGASPFGGNGAGKQEQSGTSAISNSGSGGGGGTGTQGSNYRAGSGGGAGGYIEALINSPASTYSYSVGTAGSASTNGGAGGSGFIIVEEHYL